MKGILANFDRKGNISLNGSYIRYATTDTLPRIILQTSDLAGIDELIVPGGVDIDPTIFGEDNNDSDNVNPWLDRFQMGMIGSAVAQRIPVFGICRGFQLLYLMYCSDDQNAHYSQNISGHNQNDNSVERGMGFHFVEKLRDCVLFPKYAPLLGGRVVRNSMHHQGVIASGIFPTWATSCTPLGAKGTSVVIESLEATVDGVLIQGVQWHPEELTDVTRYWWSRTNSRGASGSCSSDQVLQGVGHSGSGFKQSNTL